MNEGKENQFSEMRTAEPLITARELDIIRYVAEGLSNKEISLKLLISEGTVKNHLHNIYRKIGIKNRTILATFAIRCRDGDA